MKFGKLQNQNNFLIVALPVKAYTIIKEFYIKNKETISFDTYEKSIYLLNKIYSCYIYNNSKYKLMGRNLPFDSIKSELGLRKNELGTIIKNLTDLNIIVKKIKYCKEKHIANSYIFNPKIELTDKPQFLIQKNKLAKDGTMSKKDWKYKIINNKNTSAMILENYQLQCLENIELTEEGKKYLISKGFDLELEFEDFIYQSEVDNKQYSNQDFLFYKIFKKQFSISRKEGERLYSNLTNLNKEYKHFLTFCQNNLVEVDISNSQILFGALELNKEFKNKETEDFKLFKQLCIEGKFYEYLAEKSDTIEVLKNDRSKFKSTFLEVWFGANKENKCNYNILRKSFIEIFPSVFQEIQKIKGNNKSQWAIQLQKLEANLMLDKVAKSIIDLGIPFITIHDSFVLSSKEDAELVEQTIKDIFKNEFIDIPNLKTKQVELFDFETVNKRLELRKESKKINNMNTNNKEKMINALDKVLNKKTKTIKEETVIEVVEPIKEEKIETKVETIILKSNPIFKTLEKFEIDKKDSETIKDFIINNNLFFVVKDTLTKKYSIKLESKLSDSDIISKISSSKIYNEVLSYSLSNIYSNYSN